MAGDVWVCGEDVRKIQVSKISRAAFYKLFRHHRHHGWKHRSCGARVGSEWTRTGGV